MKSFISEYQITTFFAKTPPLERKSKIEASRLQQFEKNIKAINVKLDSEVLTKIDEILEEIKEFCSIKKVSYKDSKG
jgi:aryl-alcohol dehydrogenase-like predicted oxidoreductase